MLLIYKNSNMIPYKYLKKGFQHILMLIPINNKEYLMIERCWYGFDVQIISADRVSWMMQNPDYIFQYVDRAGVGRLPVLNQFKTCVQVAKDVIGVNNIRIQTPWQLFKYIKGDDSNG